MPRFLVQTESGSWYQVDTEAPQVLRWAGRGIMVRGAEVPNDNSQWTNLDVVRVHPFSVGHGIVPNYPMLFACKDGMTITTTKVITRTVIENLSKRRAVPA